MNLILKKKVDCWYKCYCAFRKSLNIGYFARRRKYYLNEFKYDV